jgi:hypothetical protein
VSPVKYELGFYIPEDGIVHSHRRENLPVAYTPTSMALQVMRASGSRQHVAVQPRRKLRHAGPQCRRFLPNVVRFEVFTALTMKNGVFSDVTPCGACKNQCFGGTWYFFAACVGC